MNDLQKNLLVALTEEALISRHRAFSVHPDLIRLATGLRAEQGDLFGPLIQSLVEAGYLEMWSLDSSSLSIQFNDDLTLPEPSPTELEAISDKRLRRVLLFKLYDEYRRCGTRLARFPLVSMVDIIQSDKDEIFRHVEHLEGEYLIEYGICDGGNCSCHILEYGVSLCEDRCELFEKYSAINASDTGSDTPVKHPDGEYIASARIDELVHIGNHNYDLRRVVELCRAANTANEHEHYLVLAMILRALIDHIPPVFGCSSFKQVAANYSGGISFKRIASRLDGGLRDIADSHLHKQIQVRETLPAFQQVDFRPEVDALLAKLVEVLG